MRIPFFAVCATLALGALSGNAANLIANGSFEQNLPIEGSYSVLGTGDTTSLPGWTVSGACGGNCIAPLTSSYRELDGSLAFSPQHGSQSLDITGAGNSFVGSVFQSVATTPGQQYLLSFYVGNQDDRFSGYAGAESVELLLNDSSQGIFTNANTTVADVNWLLASYSFTASSESTKVEFRNATGQGNFYTGLDNVSLVTADAPEPATIALGGAALALAAVLRRKKRS